MDAYVDIINTSNNTIDVSVVRKSEILVAGHESNFCWGVSCYPPFISTSPTPQPIAPNGVDQTFKGQLNPNGISGLSRVTYCFYNEANTADSICLEFFYDITLGINSYNAGVDYLSQPSPNPANTMAAFSYRIINPKGEISLIIRDILGQNIQKITLNSSSKNFILNTSSFKQGLYFCSLMNGDKIVKATRLSVVH